MSLANTDQDALAAESPPFAGGGVAAGFDSLSFFFGACSGGGFCLPL
jgi:hypothetical protein